MIASTHMSAKLDLRDVRPLTSSEIAKILTSVLMGVYMMDMTKASYFRHLIETAKVTGFAGPEAKEIELIAKTNGLWAVSFLATANGFFHKGGADDSMCTWCYPQDVHAALAWMGENLPVLFPAPIPN